MGRNARLWTDRWYVLSESGRDYAGYDGIKWDSPTVELGFEAG